MTDQRNIEETPEYLVANEKLTDWANQPSVRDLKQDFEEARLGHDAHVSRVQIWLDNLNGSGTARVNTPKGRSKIIPKVIRKQAEWRYASLSEPFLSTDDVFNVSPITHEDRAAAIQNQLLLNNQFNTKIDKTKFIDEYVRTAVDEGTIIMRIGWVLEEETKSVEVDDFTYVADPGMTQVHQELHAMMQSDPDRFKREIPEELQIAHALTMEQNIPVKPVKSGSHIEEITTVTKNHPTVEVCDYRNVIIDPTAMGDIDKANFVIYSFETSLSELKKEGTRYKNLEHIRVDNSSILNSPDHATKDDANFNFNDQPRKKFVAYEYWGYWDINNTGIVEPIVATWVGDTLIRLEENPFPDRKLPFITVQYLPKRKSNYGEPDGHLLEDNQKIVGAVTRGMIDILARGANGQTGMRKDMLDVTNMRKFERGDDYQYNAGVDPRMGVYQHTFTEIPQSAQFMLGMQNAEAESLTGVKAFNNGISGQALGDTATGVRGALDAASKRELGILRRLAAGIVKVGRKFISMNAEFLSEEEVVRVTNEQFVPIRRDDLAGNFDLKLSISTAEEDNQKAQELAFMLQTTGNNMDPVLSRMILADIARLRKMPDLSKRIETYQPQPDPYEQAKKQLELQLLQAQIAKEYSITDENTAQAELDRAKAIVEGVRAGNIQSDTDLKNLDFLEQESGTKQERDLQKQGAQARAQAGTKVLEHMLKMQEPKTKPV